MDARMDLVALPNLYTSASAVLGSIVLKTLQQLLSALKIWENRSTPVNIIALKKLLVDLEPAVDAFRRREGKSLDAEKWVQGLQKKLAEAKMIIDVWKPDDFNIFNWLSLSKRSLDLYSRIRMSLSQAPESLFAPHAPPQNPAHNKVMARASSLIPMTAIRTVSAAVSEKQKVLDKHDEVTLEELAHEQENFECRLRRIIQLQDSSSLQMSILSRLSENQLESVYGSGSVQKPERRLLDYKPSYISDHHESSSLAKIAPAQSASNVPKPEKAFGDETVTKKLINHLLHDNCKPWVGVWGAEGIGKSFTARKVCHDPNIQKHFSHRFWCTPSKSEQDSKLSLRQLPGELDGGESAATQLPNDMEGVKSYLSRIVDKADKLLLVLDDVRKAGVLSNFRFLSQSSKVVILVTARDKRILSSLEFETIEVFKVQRFSPKDSWKFLASHVTVARDIEHRARQVADECEGLPLLIKTFGEWMAYQGKLQAHGQITASLFNLLRRQPTELTEQEKSFVQMQVNVDGLNSTNPRLRYFLSFFAASQPTA